MIQIITEHPTATLVVLVCYTVWLSAALIYVAVLIARPKKSAPDSEVNSACFEGVPSKRVEMVRNLIKKYGR